MTYKYKNLRFNDEGKVWNATNGNLIHPLNGLYSAGTERLTYEQLEATQQHEQIKEEAISVPQHQSQQDKPLKAQHEPPTATRKKKGAQSGQENINSDGIYIIGGKKYNSAREASKQTGLRLQTLIIYCKMGCSFVHKD